MRNPMRKRGKRTLAGALAYAPRQASLESNDGLGDPPHDIIPGTGEIRK
jgi:hypothetical protein